MGDSVQPGRIIFQWKYFETVLHAIQQRMGFVLVAQKCHLNHYTSCSSLSQNGQKYWWIALELILNYSQDLPINTLVEQFEIVASIA